MADRAANIAVIGAGIVGLSCAERLSRSTDSVVVVDPSPPGRMTSWGNMGAMAFGEVIPMARPAMIAQAGFASVRAEPILGGLVAIHSGWKV